MEPSDIDRILRQHRRAWWWPWRCRCGWRYRCPPRLVAEGVLLRLEARAACEWYPVYFAPRRGAQAPDRASAPAPRPEDA